MNYEAFKTFVDYLIKTKQHGRLEIHSPSAGEKVPVFNARTITLDETAAGHYTSSLDVAVKKAIGA